MTRRVHTADEVVRHARTGATELVVAPGDLLTPLARDVAHEHGITVVHAGSDPQPQGPARARLHHVPGVDVLALMPFPVDLHRPEMDVRLLDVVGAEHGLPMAARVMSLRQGSFPWTRFLYVTYPADWGGGA